MVGEAGKIWAWPAEHAKCGIGMFTVCVEVMVAPLESLTDKGWVVDFMEAASAVKRM